MPVEIKVPDMGESVIEATVARWIKQEGEAVSAGEPVVELETDKVSLEVGAPQAGVLEKILRQEGENVQVGDTLATVSTDGEQPAVEEQPPVAPPQESAPPQAPKEQPAPSAKEAQPVPEAAAAADMAPEAAAREEPPGQAAPVQATPLAQRMAQDLGVDLSKVRPTGAGGRITKEDVQAYAAQQPPAAPPPQAAAPQPAAPPPTAVSPPRPTGDGRELQQREAATAARPETRIRMTRRRQTIARRLVEAQQTAAMLTTFNEIDMQAVIDLRKRRRESFKERYGVDLGFMSFFVKATIGALKAFPNLNAEIDGDEIVQKHYYDIGVAIGAEEGLVVPVIRDADRLNFAGIEKAIRDFVKKVNEGALSLEDLRGGTFTITNGGVFGSLMSTPILNPPQVGILGMHAIKERPVVVDGQIVIRPMMYVALSYDHRIVDGREAVQFLVRLKELVEDPEALLFG